MAKEVITVSEKEFDRLGTVHRVMEKRLTQVYGAKLLGITDRQVRNLLYKIRDHGDRGIAHGNRGREAPNKMPIELEERIGSLIESKYTDFGPTLASEKLFELDGIRVGREKLRQIMIEKGLWKVRRRRDRGIHPWRERKHCFGEMVQFDGSHHMWLEDRGPKMVFMGYIDDATNRIFGRFYEYEGVYPAMDSFRHYIERYGLPRSVYLDKHSTYKTIRQPNLDEELRGEGPCTQYQRALKELGIEVIHAHSPQAKGRIERLFGILQDRMIKEMRLAKIKTLEEANEFLETYLPLYNKRFSKTPLKQDDLHNPLAEGVDLREIFCLKDIRTINDGYTVRWKGKKFLIENASIAMRRRKAEVREHFDGELTIRFNGRYLSFHEVFEPKPERRPPQKDPVNGNGKKKGKYIPPPHHPWRRHNPALHHNCYLEKI
jgi:hypothetical protein